MPRASIATPLLEFAPAKVNLTLRVLGRRADGYHELESLVAFARLGDRLSLAPGHKLALRVSGPTAAAAGMPEDNLVLKAARALADRAPDLKLGQFHLVKSLPVAAGLGGGSADAAAALRLLTHVNDLAADDTRLVDAAVATGADVPVCLASRARLVRGSGDVLSEPIELPPLAVVLANPGVAVSTREVFAVLRGPSPPPLAGQVDARSAAAEGISSAAPSTFPRKRGKESTLLSFIADQPNDLEPPAIMLQPVIADVLTELRAIPGCRLARMSGSGATCFALFGSSRAAAAAARDLRAIRPSWWVRATVLG